MSDNRNAIPAPPIIPDDIIAKRVLETEYYKLTRGCYKAGFYSIHDRVRVEQIHPGGPYTKMTPNNFNVFVSVRQASQRPGLYIPYDQRPAFVNKFFKVIADLTCRMINGIILPEWILNQNKRRDTMEFFSLDRWSLVTAAYASNTGHMGCFTPVANFKLKNDTEIVGQRNFGSRCWRLYPDNYEIIENRNSHSMFRLLHYLLFAGYPEMRNWEEDQLNDFYAGVDHNEYGSDAMTIFNNQDVNLSHAHIVFKCYFNTINARTSYGIFSMPRNLPSDDLRDGVVRLFNTLFENAGGLWYVPTDSIIMHLLMASFYPPYGQHIIPDDYFPDDDDDNDDDDDIFQAPPSTVVIEEEEEEEPSIVQETPPPIARRTRLGRLEQEARTALETARTRTEIRRANKLAEDLSKKRRRYGHGIVVQQQQVNHIVLDSPEEIYNAWVKNSFIKFILNKSFS